MEEILHRRIGLGLGETKGPREFDAEPVQIIAKKIKTLAKENFVSKNMQTAERRGGGGRSNTVEP